MATISQTISRLAPLTQITEHSPATWTDEQTEAEPQKTLTL